MPNSQFNKKVGRMFKNKALLDAAEQGDLAALEKAVKDGADINTTDSRGASALIICLEKYPDYPESLKAAEFLLARGCDVNVKKSQSGCGTALHEALDKKLEDLALALISKGADVNAGDVCDRTPLFIAALHSLHRAADALIAKKAALDKQSMWHSTAVMAVLERAYDHNKTDDAPVDHAMLEKLLNAGASPDIPGEHRRTPLMQAVSHDDIETAKILLNYNASLEPHDIPGRTVFDLAAEYDRPHFTALFAQYSAARDMHRGTRKDIQPVKHIKFRT